MFKLFGFNFNFDFDVQTVLVSTISIFIIVYFFNRGKASSILPATIVASNSNNNATFEMLPAEFRSCCLKKIKDNVTITGKVVSVNEVAIDGDTTFDLVPDPPYKNMLTKANDAHAHGGIHCEAVCQGKNTSILPYKKPLCVNPPASAWPKFPTPKVGQRLQVTGTYALDKGLAEIHPITSIKIIS